MFLNKQQARNEKMFCFIAKVNRERRKERGEEVGKEERDSKGNTDRKERKP